MKITKLEKHHLMDHAEIMACTDPPCGALNIDGSCGTSGDAICIGVIAIDGPCGNTGDLACGGVWVQDQCDLTTGVDAHSCTGVGRSDASISMV